MRFWIQTKNQFTFTQLFLVKQRIFQFYVQKKDIQIRMQSNAEANENVTKFPS